MDQVKRRKPVIAFFLSLLLPGLGHMYNGELRNGIGIYFGFWVLLGVMGLILLSDFRGAVLFVFCALAYPIALGAHAAVRAARLQEIPLKRYNKWPYYLIAILLTHVVLDPVIAWVSQYQIVGVRTFKAPSASMEPTIAVGDCFLVTLTPGGLKTPKQGDVVVFPYPKDQSVLFVYRVVGLPGERLQIKDKVVFINDCPLDDSWAQHYDSEIKEERDDFGPVTVPRDSVFVMGDNRDYSYDSRFWGSIETKDIQGKALYIYWPSDFRRLGNRLD